MNQNKHQSEKVSWILWKAIVYLLQLTKNHHLNKEKNKHWLELTPSNNNYERKQGSQASFSSQQPQAALSSASAMDLNSAERTVRQLFSFLPPKDLLWYHLSYDLQKLIYTCNYCFLSCIHIPHTDVCSSSVSIFRQVCPKEMKNLAVLTWVCSVQMDCKIRGYHWCVGKSKQDWNQTGNVKHHSQNIYNRCVSRNI